MLLSSWARLLSVEATTSEVGASPFHSSSSSSRPSSARKSSPTSPTAASPGPAICPREDSHPLRDERQGRNEDPGPPTPPCVSAIKSIPASAAHRPGHSSHSHTLRTCARYSGALRRSHWHSRSNSRPRRPARSPSFARSWSRLMNSGSPATMLGFKTRRRCRSGVTNSVSSHAKASASNTCDAPLPS